MNNVELAIEIINLKIAREINKNTEKKYSDFLDKIKKLQNEKQKIYQNDEITIKKVIDVYGKEVKISGNK